MQNALGIMAGKLVGTTSSISPEVPESHICTYTVLNSKCAGNFVDVGQTFNVGQAVTPLVNFVFFVFSN
jgi:hypothetical protein